MSSDSSSASGVSGTIWAATVKKLPKRLWDILSVVAGLSAGIVQAPQKTPQVDQGSPLRQQGLLHLALILQLYPQHPGQLLCGWQLYRRIAGT